MRSTAIARRVRELGAPEDWYEGTALYRVTPPMEVIVDGFLTETSYVIVAVTPRAADPSTVFAANQDGSLFGDFTDRTARHRSDHYYVRRMTTRSAEFRRGRVVGSADHAQSLRQLGYDIDPIPSGDA